MDTKWFDMMEDRIPKGEVRTRFAPSPTGYMHIGNLRTALYAFLIARSKGGKFLLRIEDTDQGRYVEGAVEAIYRTLSECGLSHDEGPDIGGPVGPYVQTERRDIYGRYAELLIEKGGAYRCFCGKDEKEDLSGDSGENTGGGKDKTIKKYDGRCSRLTQTEIEEKLRMGIPYVIRQKIPREGVTEFTDEVFGSITVSNDTLDDNVLIKSDGLPTYNFANVIDDHLMGITHVVRGSEYLSSMPKYVLLYKSFGWEPPVCIHCPPVMRDAHNKLSKRKGDLSYEDLIAAGYLSGAVLNYVALLGWSPGGEREIYSLDELIEVFSIGGISKSPAIFDIVKLNHFNNEYIKALSFEKFHGMALPYIEKTIGTAFDTRAVASLLQSRCEKLTDIPGKIEFFSRLPEYSPELYINKKAKTDARISLDILKSLLPVLEGIGQWTQENIHDSLIDFAQSRGFKNATALWPLRISLSGLEVTPGGAIEICHILGKEEAIRRVRAGIELLEKEV